jgi:uncharacterized protein
VKFLLLLVIAFIVVSWLMQGKKASKTTSSSDAEGTAPTDSGEKMIQCAHCGVHVPASESVSNAAGVVFCSEDHRRLGVRR